MTARPSAHRSTQLDALESEAIHIMREVAGEFERPVLLFCGGKDSIVMLHLARKAFWPAPVPFPLMHVDTGHNFPEVIEYRDRVVAEHGLRLVVASVQDAIDDGRVVERPDGTRNPLQTVPLLDGITAHRFDAVFGGGRRDEEKARAKERVFSLRDEFGQWDPRRQRPELWDLYNGRHSPASTCASSRCPTGPSSTCGTTSSARRSSCPSIYYAHQREVFLRDGMWLAPGRLGRPARRPRRSRPHGPLPHRRRHVLHRRRRVRRADDRAEVIAEVGASRLTERGATRADDRASEAAMEDRKREGYF